MHRAWVGERDVELPCSLSVPLSPHLYVFNGLEALQALLVWGFLEALVDGHFCLKH